MTMAMFDVPIVKRRRKKARRMTFEQKAAWIVDTMTTNARLLADAKGVRGWGFTMSQVAQMIGYSRSSALLKDLFRMCGDECLVYEERALKSNGRADKEFWFYTLTEHKHAVKQKRLPL